MRAEKNPLTVYDIVGYIIPGIVFSFTIVLLTSKFFDFEHSLEKIWLWKGTFVGDLIFFIIFGTIFYLFGMIISFISSITVEKIFIFYVGYPSHLLTSDAQFKGNLGQRLIGKNLKKSVKSELFWISSLAMLPISLTLITLWLTGLVSILVKPLYTGFRRLLCAKFEIRCTMRLDIDRLSDTPDWFRFVDYYVRINVPECYSRMYNYVVIYGLLRSVCFISTICFWYGVYNLFSIWIFPTLSLLSLSASVYLTALSFIGTVLFFLAFFKFYRRYTEEAIIGFTVHEMEGEDRKEIAEIVHRERKPRGQMAAHAK